MVHTNHIKARFGNSIKRGTGEALLLIKKYPQIDFSTYIISASIKNYAYDGQCESSRAGYLKEIIGCTQNPDPIKKAIYRALLTEKEDSWSLKQLFDFAKLYALDGDQRAKKVLNRRFYRDTIEYADWFGYHEIIDVDGLKGLLFIIHAVGKALAEDPELIEDDMKLSYFQNKYPGINVYDILEEKSREDKLVKIYLNRVKDNKKSRAKLDEKRKMGGDNTYSGIIDEVENCVSKYKLRSRKYTGKELITIASALINLKDKTKIDRYLMPFYKNPFPLEIDFLFQLAGKRAKNRVDEFALAALSQVKDSRVRKYALDKIAGTSRPENYLNLLSRNYRENDAILLESIVKRTHNEHRIEQLAVILTNIYRKNKTEECKKPLEALYDKSNCGIHRNDVITILLESNVLSDRLRNEAQFDSNFATRKLVKESLNKKC